MWKLIFLSLEGGMFKIRVLADCFLWGRVNRWCFLVALIP